MAPSLRCTQVSLSDPEVDSVKQFVERMLHKQNQLGSRDFVRNDLSMKRIGHNFVGKLGEVAAAKLLGGHVDFRVWTTGTRGIDQFEPDITSGMRSNRYHVKCCHTNHTVHKRSGVVPGPKASWTADAKDPLTSKPFPHDILVFMFASEDTPHQVLALGWVYAKEVTHLWRPCRSDHMRHKCALYYTDAQDVMRPMEDMVFGEQNRERSSSL